MKSKLFLSLSLLTAVFTMNVQGMDINAELQKARELVGATVNDPRIKGSMPVAKSMVVFNALSVPTKVSTFRNPFVQMGALCATTASVVAGSLYGVSQYQKNAEQNQFDINAELIKADNLELRKQRAYKLEAARNTRFAQFKAQLNNGLSIAKNYKKTSAVVSTAVVAGLGYMGYKKLAAKYTQAKTVTTPVVTPVVNTPVVETPVVKKALVAKKAVKKSTPSRRNNCNRRK